MNRTTIRFLSILMALVMVIALMPMMALAEEGGTTVDLPTLTETYVISDSGEYIFTGSGSYGIKVESGNPTIVLNNASITVGEGSAIDVASGSNATIFVLGDNTIGTTKTESWDAPCGGIFVAEGGTLNITSNGTDNILRAHGTLAAAIGGKYDYDNNESYNAGNISISNVTVYAYTNNFHAAAIGAAGVGTCGTINITNAVVYAYGAGDRWSSAPGIGSAWGLVGWPETIPVVIISDSEVHTFRYNPYSDYIGYLGDESGDTYATGSINCGEGGSVKSSTIYCYTGLTATSTDKTVKYGALGGLLKEDGTCEGEHSGGTATCTDKAICDNCKLPYGDEPAGHSFDPTTAKCSLCGVEAIQGNGASLLLEGMVQVKQYYTFPNLDMTNDEIIVNGGVDFYQNGKLLYTKTLTESVNEKTNEVEFYVTSDGIPAKDMDKNFTMKPFMEIDDVTVYGAEKEYGVLVYAENKIVKDENTSEELKATLAALLNYGAMAQIDLLGKTEGLMNECLQGYVDGGYLDASYVDLAWNEGLIDALDTPDDSMTVNFKATDMIVDNGKSLFLKGAISVNYYKGIGHDLTGFENCTKTMYFWTEAKYNELKEAGLVLTKDNASYTVEAGDYQYSEKYGYEWAVQSEPIAAKNLSDTLYSAMVIVDDSGTEHCTGVEVYSPEQYASNMLNDGKTETVDELVQWMVTYGERARIYFESKEAS